MGTMKTLSQFLRCVRDGVCGTGGGNTNATHRSSSSSSTDDDDNEDVEEEVNDDDGEQEEGNDDGEGTYVSVAKKQQQQQNRISLGRGGGRYCRTSRSCRHESFSSSHEAEFKKCQLSSIVRDRHHPHHRTKNDINNNNNNFENDNDTKKYKDDDDQEEDEEEEPSIGQPGDKEPSSLQQQRHRHPPRRSLQQEEQRSEQFAGIRGSRSLEEAALGLWKDLQVFFEQQTITTTTTPKTKSKGKRSKEKTNTAAAPKLAMHSPTPPPIPRMVSFTRDEEYDSHGNSNKHGGEDDDDDDDDYEENKLAYYADRYKQHQQRQRKEAEEQKRQKKKGQQYYNRAADDEDTEDETKDDPFAFLFENNDDDDDDKHSRISAPRAPRRNNRSSKSKKKEGRSANGRRSAIIVPRKRDGGASSTCGSGIELIDNNNYNMEERSGMQRRHELMMEMELARSASGASSFDECLIAASAEITRSFLLNNCNSFTLDNDQDDDKNNQSSFCSLTDHAMIQNRSLARQEHRQRMKNEMLNGKSFDAGISTISKGVHEDNLEYGTEEPTLTPSSSSSLTRNNSRQSPDRSTLSLPSAPVLLRQSQTAISSPPMTVNDEAHQTLVKLLRSASVPKARTTISPPPRTINDEAHQSLVQLLRSASMPTYMDDGSEQCDSSHPNVAQIHHCDDEDCIKRSNKQIVSSSAATLRSPAILIPTTTTTPVTTDTTVTSATSSLPRITTPPSSSSSLPPLHPPSSLALISWRSISPISPRPTTGPTSLSLRPVSSGTPPPTHAQVSPPTTGGCDFFLHPSQMAATSFSPPRNACNYYPRGTKNGIFSNDDTDEYDGSSYSSDGSQNFISNLLNTNTQNHERTRRQSYHQNLGIQPRPQENSDSLPSSKHSQHDQDTAPRNEKHREQLQSSGSRGDQLKAVRKKDHVYHEKWSQNHYHHRYNDTSINNSKHPTYPRTINKTNSKDSPNERTWTPLSMNSSI